MSYRLSGPRAFILLPLLLLILSACSGGDEMRLPSEARSFMLERLKDETFPTAREAYLTLDSLQITPSTTPADVYNVVNSTTFNIYHSGHTSLALALHTGLLDILEESHSRTVADDREMLNLYVRIGASFSESGMYTVALAFYSKGLDFCKTHEGFDSFESRFYNNIGILYAQAEMYAKALEYFQKSLELNLRTDSKTEIYLNYLNFTEIYLKQNNLKAAQESIRKGMEYIGADHRDISLAQMRMQQGEIDMRLKKYDSAAIYLDDALNLFKKEEFSSGIVDTYLCLGRLYLAQNLPDSTIATARRAIRISRFSEQADPMKNAYVLISQGYVKQGADLQAISAVQEALSIQDSLIVAEHRKRLEDWETVGNKAFTQIAGNTPTETNAAIYMIIAFILLGGMIALTYYNLHHRTSPAPESLHAGDEEFLKDKLQRTDRKLQSLTLHKREHTKQMESLTSELRSIVSDHTLSDEERRRRLNDVLSELDQLRAVLQDK
ncbi:MAG: tetratricopeptide repeat protein [Bacteroides sp.]|nr:tetratricopeptide repeat protein [Bacteroides sp.]